MDLMLQSLRIKFFRVLLLRLVVAIVTAVAAAVLCV